MAKRIAAPYGSCSFEGDCASRLRGAPWRMPPWRREANCLLGTQASLGGEGDEEVVEGLLLLVLGGLEVLDAGLVLLDLGLLLAELLEVALVQLAVGGRLAQVGAQPPLVLRDDLQLPLRLG